MNFFLFFMHFSISLIKFVLWNSENAWEAKAFFFFYKQEVRNKRIEGQLGVGLIPGKVPSGFCSVSKQNPFLNMSSHKTTKCYFFLLLSPYKEFLFLTFLFSTSSIPFFLHGILTYWVCKTINFKKAGNVSCS